VARRESLLQRLDGQPDVVLWSLLGVNGVVFAGWQVLDTRFMARHFTVSDESLRSGRLHTAVTSSVSHRDGWHLAGNALSLYFFGREVGRLFGGARLAGLYLAGGVVASLSHVAWSRVRQPEHQRRLSYFAPPSPAAMGASGAVNAIIVLDTLLFPWRIVYVNLLVPVPAIVLGGLVLLRDAYGARGHSSDGVAHAGHLGGAATGLAAWAQLRLRLR
jgi:membrane associated rhomboid family serine protease